jgi:hypothetical protein
MKLYRNMNQHKDLFAAKELIFETCELAFSNLKIETESGEYGACTFHLNDLSITFRAAKITPTKIGQFVTLWKRNLEGITEPFNISDAIDFAIICTRREADFGAFIFPKSVLQEKGVLSVDNKEGKRGFRVYPPWDIAINKQAKQTQEWQLKYFLETPIDLEKAKHLFKK